MIKTHYESLDIAGHQRVHYLCFQLPPILPGPERDGELKAIIKENADLS
jgi:tRNA (guanine-N7-)-methyltransferase